MRRSPSSKAGRRDAAIGLGLLVLVVTLVVAAVADGGRSSTSRTHDADLPPGWHEIGRPITAVLYPKQVLAAATYRVVFHHRPQSCWPRAAVRQMPPDGVLVQIIEYSSTDSAGNPVRVPQLPPRPDRFSYEDGTFGSFECMGPSYKFAYMQGNHALQATVWMHRRTVSPTLRAGALQILNHFEPDA